jgi:S-ribosylhomocysteine lyase LuxS involved in autoinducer biosynthesis
MTPQQVQVLLPIIRRTMPSIIANDIIGVQPMTGPTGLIYSMRSRYSQEQVIDIAGDPMYTILCKAMYSYKLYKSRRLYKCQQSRKRWRHLIAAIFHGTII